MIEISVSPILCQCVGQAVACASLPTAAAAF